MDQFTRVCFQSDGQQSSHTPVSLDQLDPELIEHFRRRLKYLSGDLELPLESRLPRDSEHLEYRIVSDFHAAYVIYYFHDEGIFASLYLRGENAPAEDELASVFKFVLLEPEDCDAPTEEEFESLVNSNRFDFLSIPQRPAAFSVQFSKLPEEAPIISHIGNMDLHLAAAFLSDQRN